MENNLVAWKASVTAFLAAIGMVLGWRGIMAVIWLLVMMLDYVSGSLAARKRGEWSSAAAREGIWHKAGMILVVVVAALADFALTIICAQLPGMGLQWPVLALPMVLAWYILTELGSILENAVKMGANVPQWLVRGLKVGIDKFSKFDLDNSPE